MNNIIICEGSTDYVLLQYYMRKAYQWSDDPSRQSGILKMPRQKSRNLVKDSNILTVMSTGGCSRLSGGLKEVLNRNYLSDPGFSDVYSKIVVITDRDEAETEQNFIQQIENVLNEYSITYENKVENNCWIPCEMRSQIGKILEFALLLFIIPFEQNGALETFLLDAVGESDPYDKVIIDKCIAFVEGIDPNNKYLSSRRYITKAKFDTYFSVRTPAEQFAERQNILKNVEWEKYNNIQTAFQKLGEL